MNLLHVIASLDPLSGGPCQVIRNSVPELELLGVVNEVVCLDAPEANFLQHDNFKTHALGPGKSAWCHSSKLLPWLTSNLPRFDAVIVHGLWLYPSYAVSKAVRVLTKMGAASKTIGGKVPKVFVMPHGMLDPYFQKASGRRIKALRNIIYWALIEGNVIKEADSLLFTCEEELRLAREPFRPYAPKGEISVGLGILEPPVFTPRMKDAFLKKCPGVEEDSYLLFLSRIHPKKGVDLLLKAYGKMIRKLSETQLSSAVYAGADQLEVTYRSFPAAFPKLVIAGPGLESSYGREVQQLVASSDELARSVFFPGMLSGDAKWGAFYGCDAFVLPSHQENFGIAVAEALACGKPVLLSKEVNIWREIERDAGGLFAEDTLNGIYEMLMTWESMSLDQKMTMGGRARIAFEKHFAVGPAAERLRDALLV